MKLTLESTDTITSIDGQPCRVWRGVTARGIHCVVFVSRIAVEGGADTSEFEAELLAAEAPREVKRATAPEVLQAFSTRML